MFEKEAEEYRESITQRLFNEDDVESAWQKGAEFGYKKGQSDQLVHKQYQLNQLRKALEQAKKYLEECVYNVVSPERLRKDIEQFLKE